MAYDFVIADVFTRRAFGGNQLAVFPDARGLHDTRMQELAKEFGFSETTFVLPPDDPDHTCRVRIFTPVQELPFAGHPTVGTAAVLAARGQTGQLTFEEGVGPITVQTDGTFSRFVTTAPFETAGTPPSSDDVAAALSLTRDDVLDCWFGGVGVGFCYVHLTSPDTVDRATLDRAAWTAGAAKAWSPNLYMFAGDLANDTRLHARTFAPATGVDEDPATGSAAAGLVASLAHRTRTDWHIEIDQGVRMGRPSQIDATAHTQQGDLTHVTVGGHTTIVGHGTITIP